MRGIKNGVIQDLIERGYISESQYDFLDIHCQLIFDFNRNSEDNKMYLHDVLWKHKQKDEYYHYSFEVSFKPDGSWSNNMDTLIRFFKSTKDMQSELPVEQVIMVNEFNATELKEKLNDNLKNSTKTVGQRKI